MNNLFHRKPLENVLIRYQESLPEGFEYCEENGYKFDEDYKSSKTLQIKTCDKKIYFRWMNNKQVDKHFCMGRNEVEFVADLINQQVFI